MCKFIRRGVTKLKTTIKTFCLLSFFSFNGSETQNGSNKVLPLEKKSSQNPRK